MSGPGFGILPDVPPTNGIRPDVPPPRDERRVDEPVPTIVGPRSDGGPGGKVSVPQGIERLLTLAATNASWKEKVLADPVAAAAEAKVELSDSEKAILRSTPRPALAGAVDAFAKKGGRLLVRPGVVVGAVGVAAAAAVLASISAGHRVHRPANVNPPVQPEKGAPVPWALSLDDALARAKRENRSVMAVFRHPNPPVNWTTVGPTPGSQGLRPDPVNLTREERASRVVFTDSAAFRAAIGQTGLLPVRGDVLASAPVPPAGSEPATPEVQVEAWRKAYEAVFKRYGLEWTTLPAVVFLAPDGSELSKLVQPQEESQLIEAIKAVPAQLAKWRAEHPERTP